MTRLLLALALLAFDETKKVDVVCPVDGTKFSATEVVRSDAAWAWGGLDSDFCSHAFKTLPMEHYIWTCPKCWFSAPKADFTAKIPMADADKKKILGNLKPMIAIAAGAKPDDIPGHVKYDLAAQTLAALGKPASEIGKKHLHAGWAIRQSGAIWLDNFDEWQDLRTRESFERPPLELGKSNRTELELKACARLEKQVEGMKGAETTERLLIKYLLAHTYRKHGENVKAVRWLDELAKAKGFNSFIDDGTKKMRESVDVERAHQARAAEQYKKAIEDATLATNQKGEILFQLGEISRRNGDNKSAAEWYQKAGETTTDDILKKRIEAQKLLVKE